MYYYFVMNCLKSFSVLLYNTVLYMFVLFWADHVIFLKSCSYCKCIYVLTMTFQS